MPLEKTPSIDRGRLRSGGIGCNPWAIIGASYEHPADSVLSAGWDRETFVMRRADRLFGIDREHAADRVAADHLKALMRAVRHERTPCTGGCRSKAMNGSTVGRGIACGALHPHAPSKTGEGT
jgi:hypothetical protein